MAKQLNTSVRITYKDGSIKEYPSLKEASIKSGLSEAAIKIRCNKSRQGSSNKKDKIHCMWIDDTTFRSFQSKKSRNKGSSFEMEIVNRLKEIGYSNVCRSASESKKLDNNKVDIADTNGELEVAIQAKHYANFPNYFNIRSECTDPRDLVMIWKKSAEAGSISKGTLAVMDVNLFYKLLESYHNNK